MKEKQMIHIIGAGLAGCEAAWSLARRGIKVNLYEMRPQKHSPAHQTNYCAELVCSNSFRSDNMFENAVGLLHEEMRRADSLIMKMADKHKVPAGSALAVDRQAFSKEITEILTSHPLISLKRQEITSLESFKDDLVIVATGPLTSNALAQDIQNFTGQDSLSFYDAIAPIIYKDSINMDIAWEQSRYDKIGPTGNGKDYINCPLNKNQYYQLVDALLKGEKTELRAFEAINYFDGCLPIEIMAERGADTLRHGPLKPRGLTNAHQPEIKPYAVVQLRQDNHLGTLYNMVGFQTKLKYSAQIEIFQQIPGLEKAKFARLGGIHRNTFLNSPLLLDESLRLKKKPNLRFAGQITGCEGYIESAAIGLLAGIFTAEHSKNNLAITPPATTALGALLHHITQGHCQDGKKSFQPMNVNFGLFPELDNKEELGKVAKKEKGKSKKQQLAKRALLELDLWLKKLC